MTAVSACEMLYLRIGDNEVFVLVLNKIIFHLPEYHSRLGLTYKFCKNKLRDRSENVVLWSLGTFNLCSYRHRLKRTARYRMQKGKNDKLSSSKTEVRTLLSVITIFVSTIFNLWQNGRRSFRLLLNLDKSRGDKTSLKTDRSVFVIIMVDKSCPLD